MGGVSKVGWLSDHVPADLRPLPAQDGGGEGEQRICLAHTILYSVYIILLCV